MEPPESQDNHFYELGARTIWGGQRPFGISSGQLDQHLSVLGATGTGKSSALRNLILQSIEADQGCALLDPHGDLAREILDCFPTRRADHLIYFDPSDHQHPIGFNPLSNVKPDDRARVAASIVSAFKAAFGDSWGPRLQRVLHFSIASLLECQNVSLLAIPRLLVDRDYRASIVARVHDPILRGFWVDEFEPLDKRFRAEMIDPVLNKLARWSVVPALRNILGQVRNRIEPRFIMDRQRILIANLGMGILGEDAAALMGGLLVSMFHAAAMSRADVAFNERKRFTLICDEFATYATDGFASILSQARKYRLQLVLASQHQALISDELRAAISGNVGTSICFRIGEADAQMMSRQFGGVYPASSFTDLANFEVLVKQSASGSFSEPFAGTMHPPIGVLNRRTDQLIRHCRQRYSTPREVVEDRLLRWRRR